MSYTVKRFWISSSDVTTSEGATFSGQMYVEHLVPAKPNGGPPYLMIHGGGGQGLDWLQTPDGRPGWAPLLAGRGYDVYVVDRIAHGRSPYIEEHQGELGPMMPDEVLAGLFFPPPKGEGSYPMSDTHTQWPGNRNSNDLTVKAFMASQGPMLASVEAAHLLDQAALVALLDQIGPAVVVSHSAGSPSGFLLADARADAVVALVACEPLGPPLLGAPGIPLRWGVANAPLTYEPPVSSPDEIEFVVNSSGPVPLALQVQPARQLSELARVPIMLVTGESSAFRWFENHTAAYLEQAGCIVDSVRLWEHGINGNAHGFMFEANNMEILNFLIARLASDPVM